MIFAVETTADDQISGVRDMTALAVRILTAIFLFITWSTYANADKRVALVIGNSEYETRLRLLNPSNDAQDLADSLRSLGFDVIMRINADRQSFLQALAEFSRAVTGAEIGLFFYAGHGMQFNGSNYLMPIGARLQDEVSVRFDLVALEEVQRALERSAGVRILVLDACRNNPLAAELARSMRASNRDAGITRGLARIEQARGTVVAYSTQANEVAEDGTARNSPYTRALLDNLREPGLEIGVMFRKVATRVYQATGGKQVPELSISLLSEVYLNRNETDAQVWARVRAANDPAGVHDFLDRFPNSFYAADARLLLDVLEREARAQQLDRERAVRERELRDRLAAVEVERLQAEMNLRAAERAAQDATERLRQEKAERERLATEVLARQHTVAELTEQLQEESARRSQMSAEATDRERELGARLAEAEQASRKAAADLAARARASAEEVSTKDLQIATIEQARRQAEARVEALTMQALTLTAEAGNGISSPLPDGERRHEPPGAHVATVDPTVLVIAIKKELHRLGCYFAPINPNWQTPTLRKAIENFATRTHAAKVPDAPTTELLEDLKARRDGVCETTCGPHEREKDGGCVAKTCPANEVLNRDGECARPAERRTEQAPLTPPKPRRAEPRAPSPPSGAGRGGCFNFNGRQFCE